MILLDGKQTAAALKQNIAQEVQQRQSQGRKAPHLAAILVGDDGASQAYVQGKVSDCHEVGFGSTLIHLPADTTEADLLQQVAALNQNPDIDGFIVQLPLPKHIDVDKVIRSIDPEKDVDGFHPVNVGRLAKGMPTYISATPLGIIQLLAHYQIDTQGMHAVIIGRSQIVGAPMATLLSRNAQPGNCTVTVCHSKTKDIAHHTRQADLIIAALGVPEFLRGDMVKEGAVVIDVGITRVADTSRKAGYRLVGDVAFDEVAPKCSYITPVPGGVGPMTRVALLHNTLLAAK
ncbi:bifunctional 5,10-methylenetetrahydrofolate dehydrogenase/5,10-methenyltetrahydrofolate cyclohydrolase [Eisenibacter elegans]|jgi:methylenetetrahydrofolate dehydrogenase (NADP+)/methenyltetrahydrofolate cyclohydrolase|uniref:bifunctional 5,10-methylenetetrahydrofolate dehydrogenase/5,10-methenyltetrahydrofolate cyclohydrolase n=1 Tax=Eisenibacter elegans TaxID=997 RepID=UPI0004202B60|nr:tetrahydrofolate dehydrogenase/cyclohydrolase catalytic domain-containing protein [Eisenibacter elegans]